MAQHLWQQHSRHISLTKLVELVDSQPLGALNWEQSKTKAILDEGLLVCRDWYGDKEAVYFTYDLLGGYLIARYLVQQAGDNIGEFVQSKETVEALFSDDYRTLHPLHIDIGRCLAALLPVQTGQHLHELTNNEKAFSLSIHALFELPPEAVSEACVDIVAQLLEASQKVDMFLK